MDFNHFGDIANLLEPFCDQAVGDTAKAIASDYQANAPVDTGFMAGSAYAVTSTESTYGQGMGPTKKDSYLLPEVDKPDKLTAVVAVGANYAGYVELGTRFMAAQPAFYPAVDRGVAKLEDDLSGLEDYIKVHVGG